MDVVWINSTKELLTLNKETLKTSHKNLSGDVDEAVNSDICVDCEVMNIQSLDFMALAINLITNRGVNRAVTLIFILDHYAVLHLKRVIKSMVSTNISTDGVEMTKLPKNTQPNTSAFKNWCTTIGEEIKQKTSEYGIYPLGYFIFASTTPVDYGNLEQNKTLIDKCKDIGRIQGEAYHQDKMWCMP